MCTMKHENYLKSLGRRIKSLRKEKNLSQDRLSEKIDKSVDTISNIERGKFAPRLDTALEIARALDVELFELFKVRDLPLSDMQRTKLLDEIFDLLQDQPEEILRFTLSQTQQLVTLRDKFSAQLKK